MANTTSAKRITKAMRFEDIKAILCNEVAPYGSTTEDAVAFIEKELAALTKKNAAPKKPTPHQQENLEAQDQILEYLTAQTEAQTVTAILKGVPGLLDRGFTSQRVAALLRPLMAAGKVEREVVKGRSVFKMA